MPHLIHPYQISLFLDPNDPHLVDFLKSNRGDFSFYGGLFLCLKLFDVLWCENEMPPLVSPLSDRLSAARFISWGSTS